MGLGKILAGAAAGVGVIVAAPVFGAIGAITVAGAAVGAGVGAFAGGVASEMDDDERRAAREEGFSAAEMKYREMLASTVKKQHLMLHLYAIGVLASYKNAIWSDDLKLNSTALDKMDDILKLKDYLYGISGELDQIMRETGHTMENDLIETFHAMKNQVDNEIQREVTNEKSLVALYHRCNMELQALTDELGPEMKKIVNKKLSEIQIICGEPLKSQLALVS